MLTRKRLFRDLLIRGHRNVNHLTGRCEDRSAAHGNPGRTFGLPETELSPSLLAIEADLRGVSLQAGGAENLRREIFQELAENLQTQLYLVRKGG